MKRFMSLALAGLAALACRDQQITSPEREFGRHANRAAAAVAPSAFTDAYAVYISSSRSVLVLGVPSNDTLAVIPVGNYAFWSAASPDGQRVYVVMIEGYVQQLAVIRTSDNSIVANIPLGAGAGAAGVVVSPDNERVYVANRGGNIWVIDATTLQLLAPIPVIGVAPFNLDITPDGSHLYVGNDDYGRVAVVDLTTRLLEGYIGVGNGLWGLDMTADGQYVYTSSRTGTVSKISTASNTVVATITLGGAPLGIATTPDGQEAYVANALNNNVAVISIPTDQILATVPLTAAFVAGASPDGRWVYVTQGALIDRVAVIDAQTHEIAASFPVASPTTGISFVPHVPPSQPTSTSTGSAVNPSVTGESVIFTATVTSGTTPVTIGDVTFRLGGTTCADAPTVIGGPLPLDAAGQATASQAFLAAGSPYTVRACYGGTATAPLYDPSEGSITQTVIAASVGLTAAATPASQQYSDMVVLSATLSLEAGALQGETLTGLLTYSINGTTAGAAAVSTATLPTTVTLTPARVVGFAAGSYPVAATFASGNANFVAGMAAGASLAVTAEAAAITPDPGFPTEARVTTPLGSSGPLSFGFAVHEVSPELNADPSLAAPGDLSLAEARLVLTPSGGGALVILACGGGVVSGSGYGQARPFTCTTLGLPAEVYQAALQVIAAPGGSYYAASETRTLRIYDPSAEISALGTEIGILVENGTLSPGNGNALGAKLEAALASIARGSDKTAINQLQLFIGQVEALVPKKLPTDIGDQLIAGAHAIMADLAE